MVRVRTVDLRGIRMEDYEDGWNDGYYEGRKEALDPLIKLVEKDLELFREHLIQEKSGEIDDSWIYHMYKADSYLGTEIPWLQILTYLRENY